MSEPVNYRALARMNRAYMAEVWQKRLDGTEFLTGDEHILAELMEMHPEYEPFWENIEEYGDRFFDPNREENPFLHVSLHVTLEQQIRSGNPPCVLETMQRLIARDSDPHEARHAVMGVLVRQLWGLASEQRALDGERFAEELKKL